MPHRSRWSTLVLGLAVLSLVLVAGCGSSSSSSSSGDGSSTAGSSTGEASTTAESGDQNLAEMESNVDQLLGPKGSFEAPPSTAPKPKANQNVWLISCSQAVTACSGAITGAENAAKALGWKTTVFDAKYDLPSASTGIREALADKADAIFVYYIDCQYMSSALKEAAQAGVPVMSAESIDCNQSGGGEPLFSGEVTYAQGPFLSWVKAWSQAQAEYAIVDLGGKANMALFADNSLLGSKSLTKSVTETFERCSGCEFVPVEFPITDLGSKLQSTASSTLLTNPSVNAVMGAYEAIMLSGVITATQETGRNILVDIGEGTAEGMEKVRAGEADYGAGLPVEWEGWSGIDGIVRLLDGEEPVSSGIGVQLFDKEHNMPAEGGYQPPIDFEKDYEEAWGVR